MLVTLAEVLLPEGMLIALGYALCRLTRLNRQVWDQVDRLVYYVFFPLLLFRSVSRGELDASSWLFMGVGWLLALGSMALVLALPFVLRIARHGEGYAPAAQVGFRFNSFIGLAIAHGLGGQASFYMSLLIGACVPLLNLAAVWPMARGRNLPLRRELAKNPLILATLAGLLVAASGLHLPPVAGSLLDRFGVVAITLGLLAVGAGMKMRAISKHKSLSLLLLCCKHVATPLLALCLGLVFAVSREQLVVLVVFGSLPTATSCYVLAKNMGYEAGYIASLVTFSTMLGALGLSLALVLI